MNRDRDRKAGRGGRGSAVLDERKGYVDSAVASSMGRRAAHPCPRLRAVLVCIYAGLGAARLWSSRLLHFARAKPSTQIPSKNRGGLMVTADPRMGQFR
jgi:hypothetical protein